MKILRNILLFATLASVFAIAQNAAKPTLADAQKAYVAGNWKEAAAAYEKVCPSQPADSQVSCNLWGILAMSQVGDAKSFKNAGVKLDSLINATNPQHNNYADLIMTRAQFMLYLGKYDKAAEDLIHAIETGKDSHNLVLQKVCSAVLSRTKSRDLSERCETLKNPVNQPAVQPAPTTQPTPQSSTASVAPAPQSATSSAAAVPVSSAVETPAKQVPQSSAAAVPQQEAKPVPTEPAKPETSKAAEVKPTGTSAAPAKPAEEYWVLQLGAFGMKSNATLLAANLKKQKIQSTIIEQERGERILFIVQTGHFATKEAANAYGEKTLAPLKVEYQALLKK